MRAASVVAAIVGVALLPLSVGAAVAERADKRTEVASSLRATAGDEAARIEAYFTRARSVILLTANNPAFADFYSAPGSRLEKVQERGLLIGRIERALRYLGKLYPQGIGEACFIDRLGAENARIVRDVPAPASQLSANESGHAFFRATLALGPGKVYQASPYISPDTHDWVVSNSTLVPGDGTRPPGLVHFEVPIESFRRTAALNSQGRVVQVVDARTGDIVFESGIEQRPGKRLGRAGLGKFGSVINARAGTSTISGRPAAFQAIPAAPGNANRWIIVVSSPIAGPSLLAGFGPAPLGMFLAAVILLLFAILGMTTSRNELLAAAMTDSLTGLGNRRRFVRELEQWIAATTENKPLVLVLYDLDGFKSYNDTFGHPAGDALLARLARRLGAALPKKGSAYRMGGDEFCVLAPAAHGVAEAVALAGAAALSERGEGFVVTASHGTVVVPSEAQTASEALRLADQRMYARKQGGRPSADRQSADVLVRALYERHPDVGEHVDEVAELAEAVCARFGLGTAERRAVRRAARLHDVGKMAVPDAILEKPGPLDGEEWAFMRRHTLIGERILAAAPSLESVAPLVRSSHERWDGKGYPDRLSGEEIPLGSRIIAVCDAFHAMTSDRSYRPTRAAADAQAELRRCAGSQFDPKVVEAFCAVLAERIPRAA